MTKILALNPDAKEGDEKVKQPENASVSPTVLQPAFFPVTLPISSIVAKKKKCRISHLIIALLFLWILVTVAIVFHILPNTFYRSVRHLFTTENAARESSPSQPYVFDISEPNIRMPSKLGLVDNENPESRNEFNPDRYAMQDNRDGRVLGIHGGQVSGNEDGNAKPDTAASPSRFEAIKAIETLLKVPGVQQVAVVQSNVKIPDSGMMRSDNDENVIRPPIGIPPPPPSSEEGFSQMRVPFAPQMQMNDWELMNYRRAMREWLLRREMFRRRMMIELEREREVAAEREMPRFMMGPQQELQQPQPPVPMFPMMWTDRIPPAMSPPLPPPPPPPAMMHRIMPPMMMMQHGMPMVPPNMAMPPRIPPMHPFMFHQQQSQMMQFPMMPPRMSSSGEEHSEQNELNPGPPGIIPPNVHDGSVDRPDNMEQEKVPIVDEHTPMTSDGTPDRDAIFKELRSQAQVQQQQQHQVDIMPVQQQQQQEPQAMLRPIVPVVAPSILRNAEEIFQKLQHRALQMQLEQDRQEAEERDRKETNVDGDAPVLMIADTFPRRPVVVEPEDTTEEVTEATTTIAITETTVLDENAGNSSEPLSAYFKFFDEETRKNEENSAQSEQDITVNDANATAEQSSEESSDDNNDSTPAVAADKDQNELIIKPDDTAPEVVFKQDGITIASKENSGEIQSDSPLVAAISQDKIDNNMLNSETIVDTSKKLLETPQIPTIAVL